MPKKLLKKGELHLSDISSSEPNAESSTTVTLDSWQESKLEDLGTKGILVPADTTVDQLRDLKPGYAFIGVQFNAFSDGRGFSLASQIRSQLNFEGDIRACGDVIADQISSLLNCGFSSIELPADINDALIAEFVTPFTESYQTHQQSPTPLYRRISR